MAEAIYKYDGEMIDWLADDDYSSGDVIQLGDGRAGVVSVDVASGYKVGVYTSGIFEVQKTASIVVLMGSQLYWDHSANKCHLIHGNDRDFPLGVAVGGGPTNVATVSAGVTGPTIAASAAGTVVRVALNKQVTYNLSLADGYHSIPISTAGWPHIYGGGNTVGFKFDTTAEAQKLDALSIRGVAITSNPIVDAEFCMNLNGDDAAFDFNIGLANGSHATDANSITEYLFAHTNGASLVLNAMSTDATTTVAEVTTTVSFVVGTPILVQWDLANLEDIQMYVNGINVLGASVFKLNLATGPLKLLAHMEKTSNDSPGNVTIMRLGARTSQV